MLQASELRIGNWVKDGDYYEQIVFTDIADLITGVGGAYLYKPVELTPEILNGLFKYDQNDGWNIGGSFDIDNELNLSYRHWEGSDERGGTEGHPIIKISSVHHLQNIYYSIFGTELNINL